MDGPVAAEGTAAPDLWGGLECSVVRVGGHLRDQSARRGTTTAWPTSRPPSV
jgi:hypothetical protein